jgi:hypothetical protein
VSEDLNPETREISPIRGNFHEPSITPDARRHQEFRVPCRFPGEGAARGQGRASEERVFLGLRPGIPRLTAERPSRAVRAPVAAGCGMPGPVAAPPVTLCTALGARTGEISAVRRGRRSLRDDQLRQAERDNLRGRQSSRGCLDVGRQLTGGRLYCPTIGHAAHVARVTAQGARVRLTTAAPQGACAICRMYAQVGLIADVVTGHSILGRSMRETVHRSSVMG